MRRGALAEGLEARVVGDRADRDAQPGVHARLDALQRVQFVGERQGVVGGLVAAALRDGVVDGAQGALELVAQGGDAGVDAAGGGGVAADALEMAFLGRVGDGGEQAVDLGVVHELRRAFR